MLLEHRGPDVKSILISRAKMLAKPRAGSLPHFGGEGAAGAGRDVVAGGNLGVTSQLLTIHQYSPDVLN
jgi:hypothetical protein